MAALSKDAIEEQDLRDPLHFAMASCDADVLTLVREALAAKRAKLAFQPIVTAGPQGCVAFYEGLIRVMDQSGRVIPAAQFMPVIEKTDLERQVDCVTLDLALSLLRKKPNLRLSINLSARSIGDGQWRRCWGKWAPIVCRVIFTACRALISDGSCRICIAIMQVQKSRCATQNQSLG